MRHAVAEAGMNWTDAVKLASAAGAAAVIFVNTHDKLMKISGESGYNSDIPVLMIKSSDALRLRKHGRSLLREMSGEF